MLALLALSSALAGVVTTCSATEATASAHGSWRVYGVPDADTVEGRDAGYSSAESSIATAFGSSAEMELCPDGDPMRGLDLPVRRLGLIAVDVDPAALGGSCPSTSWARGEGVVEGSANVETRRLEAGVRARAALEVDADNAANITVDAGAGGRFSGAWQWRSSGARTRIAGTVTVGLDDSGGGGRLNVPGFARVDAWNGQVDAWVRRGDVYEHLVGPAPMTLEVWAVVGSRGGSLCASGFASVGAFANDADGRLDAETALAFAFDVTPSEAEADRTPRDAPVFDLCACE